MLPAGSKENQRRDFSFFSNDGNQENKAIYIKNHFKHFCGRGSVYIDSTVVK